MVGYPISNVGIPSFRVAVSVARRYSNKNSAPYIVTHDEEDGFCVMSLTDYHGVDGVSRIIYTTTEG